MSLSLFTFFWGDSKSQGPSLNSQLFTYFAPQTFLLRIVVFIYFPKRVKVLKLTFGS